MGIPSRTAARECHFVDRVRSAGQGVAWNKTDGQLLARLQTCGASGPPAAKGTRVACLAHMTFRNASFSIEHALRSKLQLLALLALLATGCSKTSGERTSIGTEANRGQKSQAPEPDEREDARVVGGRILAMRVPEAPSLSASDRSSTGPSPDDAVTLQVDEFLQSEGRYEGHVVRVRGEVMSVHDNPHLPFRPVGIGMPAGTPPANLHRSLAHEMVQAIPHVRPGPWVQCRQERSGPPPARRERVEAHGIATGLELRDCHVEIIDSGT